MRVLLVSTYYPPQRATASQRVHANALAWAARGIDITVLTTAKPADQRGEPMESPGVRVVEIPCPVPAMLAGVRARAARSGARPGLRTGSDAGIGDRPKGLGAVMRAVRERTGIYATLRMPDLTDAWVRPAVRAAETLVDRDGTPFDLVVASSGPYTTLLVAERLRRAGLARSFIAEFRDLWTANHTASGVFPFTVRERMLERRVLAAADAVVTVTEPLASALRAQTRAPVGVVYNGHAGRRPAADHPPGPPTLVYTGTLYPRGQDTGPLLGALAFIKDRRGPDALRLVIAGTSCDAWAREAEAAGVADMLDLRGSVPAAAALALQDSAAGLVIIEWSDPTKGVLTAKVFEYLAAAPVLVTGPAGAITDLIDETGRGVHAGGTPEAIASAIEDVLAGVTADRLPVDLAAVDRYSRAAQADAYAGILERVVSRGLTP